MVKKSVAIKDSQWACRNRCQVVFLPRTGAGSNPLRRRMLSTVESLTLNPRLSKAPTIAAPSWIFCDQFDDEFFEFRIHGRSTDLVGPGKGPLFGDQATEPTQQSVWSDQSGDLAKAPSTDELGFASKSDSLGVGKAPGFAAQLFEENAIFLLEEFDDRLLVSVHPAGDGNKEELELSCHRLKNLSKVAAAQSSRLSFLVVQGQIK